MSIRVRLIAAVLVLVAPVVVAAGWLLHDRVASAIRGSFDRQLEASARIVGELAERDEEGYEFEIDPATARLLTGGDGTAIQVWTPGGARLYRSGETDLPRGGALDRPELVDLSIAGRRYRAAALRLSPRAEGVEPGEPLFLTVARPTGSVDATLARLRWWFAGIAAALLLACAVLVGRGVAVGLAPLSALSAEIEDLDTGSLDGRVDAAGAPAELAPLVATLNDLLARHESAFARERRFTADAAHELRTPLAVLRTEIEVALRQDRGVPHYRRILEDAIATIEEMSRSLEALLTIARADAGRIAVRPEPVALGGLVSECWRGVAATAGERQVELEVELPGEPAWQTDRALLALVVRNLLGNAAVHGAADVVRVRRRGDGALVVQNRAPDLEAADVDRMFERFWRRDAARSDVASHSGLGLALVRALAPHLGIEVTAELDGDVLSIAVKPTDDKGDPR